MTDAVVGGATGRLGSIVCRLISGSGDLELGGAVVSAGDKNISEEVSSTEVAAKAVAGIPETNTDPISGAMAVPDGTLGLLASDTGKFGTSSLAAAGLAMGVNVFRKACGMPAGHLPDYDAEVIGTHRDKKKDARGTAEEAVRRLRAASGVTGTVYGRGDTAGPRGREIGVHSIRAGDVAGDHTVLFAKNSNVIELKHRTGSRDVFALGCIGSISRTAEKKDGKVHGMDEVLGIC